MRCCAGPRTILLAAACQEGAGAPEFQRMLLESMTDVEFLKSIEDAPVTVDQWQLEKLALVTTRQQLLCYLPGLPVQYRANLWGRLYDTLDAAVAAVTAGLPADASIAVIPEGPYVLARADYSRVTVGALL